MAQIDEPILDQMQALITRWKAQADQRAVFLECYRMMTYNMLESLQTGEFEDSLWVDRLLHRFSDYYFAALARYERQPTSAPAVWQLAHTRACMPQVPVLQKLLLGVNAHINYDLVLTVDELLAPEWDRITPSLLQTRHRDYTRVNDVIGRTIDAVQDQILEPANPIMDVFDRLLGPVDELLISRLISSWRENVWRHAVNLRENPAPERRDPLVLRVEHDALRIGDLIG